MQPFCFDCYLSLSISLWGQQKCIQAIDASWPCPLKLQNCSEGKNKKDMGWVPEEVPGNMLATMVVLIIISHITVCYTWYEGRQGPEAASSLCSLSKANYSLSFALIQIHLWTITYIKSMAEKHILL